MGENKLYVGIDLGTTFSSISYWDGNTKEPKMIKFNEDDSIPSWISFGQCEIGGTIVGREAKNEIHSEYVCYDSKRIIGKQMSQIEFDDMNNWPFMIEPYEEGNEESDATIGIIDPRVLYKQEYFYPEEISALILRYLLNKLQEQVNKKIESVCITVPTIFNDQQKFATLRAAELAGFEHVQLLNEPTASILEYQRIYHYSLKKNDKILVVDFGGGTVDISCCQIIDEERIQVVANGGDEHLGGNEFDKVMMNIIKEKLQEENLIDEEFFEITFDNKAIPYEENQKRRNINKLRKEAERIKIELSKNLSSTFEIMEFIENEEYQGEEMSISREEFEERCKEEGLYERFTKELKRVTTKAGFTKRNTNLILLIGGTCQIPSVQQEIFKFFDQQKVGKKEFDGMISVCKGACYKAYTERIGRKIIQETIPQPIGFELSGGRFDILIKDGEKIPTKVKRTYCTSYDNETEAIFSIYSGFSKFTNDISMIMIDRLKITGIPPKPKGEIKFNVIMEINEFGMIKINASYNSNGELSESKELETFMELTKPNDFLQQLDNHLSNTNGGYWI